MTKQFSFLIGSSLLAVSSTLIAIAPAQAFSLTFGEDSASSNSPATGASATVDFTFTDTVDGIQLDLFFDNTTDETTFGAGATEGILVGFVLDIVEAVNSVSLIDLGAFDAFQFDEDGITFEPFSNNGVNFGSFNGNFDVELDDTGSPQDGVLEGASTTVKLLLDSAENAATIESAFFNGFNAGTIRAATRFQDVNAGSGSDKLLIGSVDNGGPEPEPVPEPAAMAGLIAIGAGVVINRRKQAK